MPKNFKGGNKTKRGKNTIKIQHLILSGKDTKYGVIVSNLGNGRCSLNFIGSNGIEKPATGHIRGCVRRVKFLKDDLILCGLREFGNNTNLPDVDIIFKYSLDHTNQLINMKEIKWINPKSETEDIGIDFTNESDESDENNEDDEDNEDNNENEELGIISESKIKLSIQKKLDKITIGGKKSKAVNNVKRDIKKNNEIFDILNTTIDNFKFEDI
jgi:hypothetical protein